MKHNAKLVGMTKTAGQLAEGLNTKIAEVNLFQFETQDAVNARLEDGRLIVVSIAPLKGSKGGHMATASVTDDEKRRDVRQQKWRIEPRASINMVKILAFLNANL